MEHRLDSEIANYQERARRRTRRRWPDDGLPARHKRARPSAPLVSAALIAELFWR